MTRTKTEEWFRLGLGTTLNLVLWPLVQSLGRWSSYERESRLMLLASSLGVVALVAIIPLFWRGQPWQAPIAFLLMLLPLIALYLAVTHIITGS